MLLYIYFATIYAQPWTLLGVWPESGTPSGQKRGYAPGTTYHQTDYAFPSQKLSYLQDYSKAHERNGGPKSPASAATAIAARCAQTNLKEHSRAGSFLLAGCSNCSRKKAP